MKKLFLGLYLAFAGFSLSAQTTYYVDAARPNDSGDGLSWTTAKKNIQAAIGLAVSIDTIVVTNGIYAPISITDNRPILIRSVNGADVTRIDGGGTSRCATLGDNPRDTNTVLTGFTLRNGYLGSGGEGGGSYAGTLNNCTLSGNTASSSGGGSCYSMLNNCTLSGNKASSGGGSRYGTLSNCTLSGNTAAYGGGSANCTLNTCTLSGNTATSFGGGSNEGTLNNCTLSANTAKSGGGGSCYGTLNNCTLFGNTAAYGGGSEEGTLNNCTLSGNTASASGGGSAYSKLNNCTLSGNTATYEGGGSEGGTLNNCTLFGNTADWGGGSCYGTLNNCTLFGNTATDSGGGSCDGTLKNCTLSGNTATYYGGGSYDETLNNCIVWGNSINGTTNNYYVGTFSYSCTTPLPAGAGNIAADPLFINAAVTNLRLRVGSPCINTGLNAGVSGTTDLDGNPRISGGQVDMGCYELSFTNQAALVVVAVGSKVYGDVPFQLATTGGSGTGTVSYLLVSGPGTVSSSGLVTITGVGNLVVQATKARDDNYNSVTSANLTITVNKASQTVLVITSPGPKTYGDAAFQLATTGGSGIGAVSYLRVSGPGTVSSSGLVTITGAGNLVVQATKAGDANYNSVTSGNLSITVNKATQAALVITSPGTKTYGNAAFQLVTTGGSSTGTVSYLLISGSGTVSSSGSVTITGAGDIAVQATKAADDNYNSVTSANLTITVNKADQTAVVITSPGTKTYGNAPFQLVTTGGSGTGTVNYLLVSGPGTVSSSGLVTITGAGDIVVQATKAADNNYNNSVTSANLSITVNKANQVALVITSPGIKTYGNPAFLLATTGGGSTGTVNYLLVSGPGTVSSSGLVTITGTGDIVVQATKDADDNYSAVTSANLTITVNRTSQMVFYVDATKLDDSGNGLSWTTAKQSIQAAIGLAVSNDTIVVTNGIYAPISITDNLPIFIRSVNGADVTLIDGGGANRCATLGSATAHTNTVLTGFTLCNGYGADGPGGGSCYGTLNTCTLSGNTAQSGGGSYNGTLNTCMLFGNTALSGGGSYNGTLNTCTLSENTAQSGGGSYNGTLNNCTLSGNMAQSGGGSANGTLKNCILFGNTASSSGGGSYRSALRNCTLSENSASFYGGGSYVGSLTNCIVWGNFGNGTTNNYYSGTFSHSCTGPLPSGGDGNIAADPLFVNAAAMNLRLQVGSPCINTGLNAGVSGTTDLDGNPRIIGGEVDMGCYESLMTQAELVITSPGPKMYGDAPFQLATTGGSGTGTVSYLLVSGPGTVSSSGWVTITGLGNLVVQATKAGDDTYSSVTSANLSIQVNRAKPTLYIIR